MGIFRVRGLLSALLISAIVASTAAWARCTIFASTPPNGGTRSRYHLLVEHGLAGLIAGSNSLERHLDQQKATFQNVLEGNLSEAEARELALTLEGLRFTDHVHVADDIIKIFLSTRVGGLLKSKLYLKYNENEDPEDVTFENIRRARLKLRDGTQSPSPQRLKSVHRVAMAGGVEGVKESELGEFRDYDVQGSQEEHPITGKNSEPLRKISIWILRSPVKKMVTSMGISNTWEFLQRVLKH